MARGKVVPPESVFICNSTNLSFWKPVATRGQEPWDLGKASIPFANGHWPFATTASLFQTGQLADVQGPSIEHSETFFLATGISWQSSAVSGFVGTGLAHTVIFVSGDACLPAYELIIIIIIYYCYFKVYLY